MDRFKTTTNEEPAYDFAANFLPIGGQKVECMVTDYALASDNFLDEYFPSLFKRGKLKRKVRMYLADED